jgi:hypothetical protein
MKRRQRKKLSLNIKMASQRQLRQRVVQRHFRHDLAGIGAQRPRKKTQTTLPETLRKVLPEGAVRLPGMENPLLPIPDWKLGSEEQLRNVCRFLKVDPANLSREEMISQCDYTTVFPGLDVAALQRTCTEILKKHKLSKAEIASIASSTNKDKLASCILAGEMRLKDPLKMLEQSNMPAEEKEKLLNEYKQGEKLANEFYKENKSALPPKADLDKASQVFAANLAESVKVMVTPVELLSSQQGGASASGWRSWIPGVSAITQPLQTLKKGAKYAMSTLWSWISRLAKWGFDWIAWLVASPITRLVFMVLVSILTQYLCMTMKTAYYQYQYHFGRSPTGDTRGFLIDMISKGWDKLWTGAKDLITQFYSLAVGSIPGAGIALAATTGALMVILIGIGLVMVPSLVSVIVRNPGFFFPPAAIIACINYTPPSLAEPTVPPRQPSTTRVEAPEVRFGTERPAAPFAQTPLSASYPESYRMGLASSSQAQPESYMRGLGQTFQPEYTPEVEPTFPLPEPLPPISRTSPFPVGTDASEGSQLSTALGPSWEVPVSAD